MKKVTGETYRKLIGSSINGVSNETQMLRQHGIRRNLLEESMRNYDMMKCLRFFSTKRWIDYSDHRLTSYPYGYQKP